MVYTYMKICFQYLYVYVMQEKADLLRQGHLPLSVAGLYQADGFTSSDQVIPD